MVDQAKKTSGDLEIPSVCGQLSPKARTLVVVENRQGGRTAARPPVRTLCREGRQRATVDVFVRPARPRSSNYRSEYRIGRLLEPLDKRGGDELELSVQLNGSQPRQQFGEEAVHLHASERGTQAEVHAEAECQVLVGISADVEAEGSSNTSSSRLAET